MENVENKKPGSKSLKDIVEISPDFLELARTTTFGLYQAGKFDDAIVMIKGLLAADNRDAWALGLYGTIMRKQNKFKEALVLLETAHAIDPSDENIKTMRDELTAFVQALVDLKKSSQPQPS